MKRPTPDTDAVAAYEGNWDTKALRMTVHARKLERERDEARYEAAMWAFQRDEARAEIQRLRLDAQKEAEHHDRMVKELESLYDKLKS